MMSTMLLKAPDLTLSSIDESRVSPYELLLQKVHKINKEMHLNIIHFPPDFFYDEDRMACFLFDLQNFPTRTVLQRLEKEGAVIKQPT